MDKNIYRFKFSEGFLEKLLIFTDIHRYDEIPIFKEEWLKWVEVHNNLIDVETRRLKHAGYKGIVLNKMYKSARYYFKNKALNKQTPKKRRTYIRLPKEFLVLIDEFVKNHSDKPSILWDKFMADQGRIIKGVEEDLCEKGLGCDMIKKKMKKTFKNRYFKLK